MRCLFLLYDVISYLEKNKYPGMLLLKDFEKAFDSVSWEFLFKVIEYFNFGNSFMKWIKVFSSPEPKAQGELLPSANVRRPSCDVRRASSTIASNDISSETARPRTLIFGM